MSMELTNPLALTYLTEGGAHVVYALDESIPASPTDAPPSDADEYGSSTPPPTELPPWSVDAPSDATPSMRKVVRLQKAVAATAPPSAADDAARQAVRPRFPPAYVLWEERAAVAPALLKDLDASLKTMETMGVRPANRCGVYLRLDQKHASLFEDMRARPGADRATLELKPKWLVPSPYAPAGARRCRTCAVRAMRQAAKESQGHSSGGSTVGLEGSFCPLRLVSGDEVTVRTVAEMLLEKEYGKASREKDDALGPLVDFLANCDALRVLRDLQNEFLPHFRLPPGEPVDSKTLWAMTLRDCSLFIRVSLSAHAT